jgi:hypothetical protein
VKPIDQKRRLNQNANEVIVSDYKTKEYMKIYEYGFNIGNLNDSKYNNVYISDYKQSIFFKGFLNARKKIRVFNGN